MSVISNDTNKTALSYLRSDTHYLRGRTFDDSVTFLDDAKSIPPECWIPLGVITPRCWLIPLG